MAESAYLEQKRVRPGSAALVIAMHGAALAALLLAKNPEFVRNAWTRTKVDLIEVPIPPAPPPPETRPQPDRQSFIDVPDRVLPIPTTGPVVDRPPPGPTIWTPGPVGDQIAPEPPRPTVVEPPPAPPVRIEARVLDGDLQPPYPASEERAEREGVVVIRVTVGTDGRVVAARKVRATSDAFYEATERHARARWRFRPATVDGRPVETQRTMTVHFELRG